MRIRQLDVFPQLTSEPQNNTEQMRKCSGLLIENIGHWTPFHREPKSCKTVLYA